jgi:glycogen debranching enzyme GlgX
MKKNVFKGTPRPLGATIGEKGINFALFSKHATAVTLYIKEEAKEQCIILDPKFNRTGDVWHVLIKYVSLPLRYGYKIDGPKTPPHSFDSEDLLTDPYATLLSTPTHWGEEAQEPPLAILDHRKPFDWQGVANPELSMQELIIYEMHVRGFTRHPSSCIRHPGTFLGIIEKIPYLLELGINAVELMPIQEFNECETKHHNPKTHEKLYNYWGYSTVNFFMPMNRYGSGTFDVITEFKTMVRELHRNGIEVILDVVFNHTGEKKLGQAPYSFKGIDHSVYYMLKGNDECNYTGCGHTMNLNHPIMRQFVRDCLYYWVTEMHIDGFRFDLASIMNRDMKGRLLQPSALIEELTYDPFLSKVKFIAEPWDLGGYQLGYFYPEEDRWSEWNDRYRDAVRKFIKGDSGSKNEFASRITGSDDIFPFRSSGATINYITAHDGFSLADLVSYNKKHNLENGERNQDGTSNNNSWNCGNEGATTEIEIYNLRQRQIKNFLFTLLISKGVPMLLMGDEYCHTKNGNNNTWCQDNERNWFLWEKHSLIGNFVQQLIQFRKQHPILTDNHYHQDQILWYGIDGSPIDWDDPTPYLSFVILDPQENDLFIAFNATGNSVSITLPDPGSNKVWRHIVNTNATSPYDFMSEETAPYLEAPDYILERYASILLKKVFKN